MVETAGLPGVDGMPGNNGTDGIPGLAGEPGAHGKRGKRGQYMKNNIMHMNEWIQMHLFLFPEDKEEDFIHSENMSCV